MVKARRQDLNEWVSGAVPREWAVDQAGNVWYVCITSTSIKYCPCVLFVTCIIKLSEFLVRLFTIY